MSQATSGRDMVSQRRVSGVGVCDHPLATEGVLGMESRAPRRDLAAMVGIEVRGISMSTEVEVLGTRAGVRPEVERVETILAGALRRWWCQLVSSGISAPVVMRCGCRGLLVF